MMILRIGPIRVETDFKLHYPENQMIAVGSFTVSQDSLVVIDKTGQTISLYMNISFLSPIHQSLIRSKKNRDQWVFTILYREQLYTGPIKYEWDLNRIVSNLICSDMR